jgi:chitodextrinase
VSLSWTASTDNVGVTGYQVLRAGTPVATVTGTSYSDSGLTPSTAYTYTVKAIDAAGNNSALSAPLTVSTAPAANPNSYEAEASGNTLAGGATVAACTPCSGGAKVGYLGNGGTLTFTGVNGGTGGTKAVTVSYTSAESRTATIQVNAGTPVSVTFPSSGGWTTPGTATVNLTFTAGTNTVKFANPSGWAPDIDKISLPGSGTSDTTAPSAPSGLASPTQSSTTVALTWNASTDNVGVTGYRVYRGGTEVGTASSTSFTDTGLSASTAYSYTVKAYDAAGNLSAASNTLNVSTNGTSATGLVVDNFDGSPAYPSANLNDLGKWTGGNCFLNGSGSGVVGGGALTLQYNNCGWFGSDVATDVSARTYLVVRVKGATGGEQAHFSLSLGGATKTFADFTLDGGAHPVLTTSYQDIRIPMTANGINRAAPGQLAMGFWFGGNSSISIDEIRFE